MRYGEDMTEKKPKGRDCVTVYLGARPEISKIEEVFTQIVRFRKSKNE